MWRFLPLLLLPALGIGFATLGLQDSMVWVQLGTRFLALQDYAATHAVLAAAALILSYAAMAAICLPVGPAMGVIAGALFGSFAGTIYSIIGATLGALPMFFWAGAAFGRIQAGRYAATLARVRIRLQQHGFSALLALRVLPVLPSWGLNIGAALAGLRVEVFVVATMLGLIPATAVFASIGSGLGEALADGTAPSLALVMRPPVLLPLLALSGLVLLPVGVRLTRSRQANRSSGDYS